MKLTSTALYAVVLGAAGLLAGPAAAEFDCQKTALCQLEKARAKADDRAQPTPERDARATSTPPGFVPSRTAVRMRRARAQATSPARDTPRADAPSIPTCRTKPAVCARLKR